MCVCVCVCVREREGGGSERGVNTSSHQVYVSNHYNLVFFLIIVSCLLLQRSKRDFSNFDSDFISENPTLTPIDGDTVRSLNQTEFEGFTFTNSEFKD